MDIKVETLLFKPMAKGTSALYRQQKREAVKKICAHSETYQADINQGDMFLTATICKACNKIIS